MTLAVSLHAADRRAARDELVPLNRRYPIAEVLDAAAEFAGAKGRRVTFEYACIEGVNDSPAQAEALRRLLRRVPRRRWRPREPDPVEPDRRVRRPRAPGAVAAGVRGPGAAAWGHRHGAPEPGHRHRRRVRAAALAGGDTSRVGGIGHNGAVNQWKWVNQFQPQTLYMATILCYVDAVFGLLFGFVATSVLAGLITIAALAAGGFGIANEKKWGYAVAVGGAILQVVMLFAVFGTEVLTSLVIINLLFDGALVALLLHPMSREYQRIWFK